MQIFLGCPIMEGGIALEALSFILEYGANFSWKLLESPGISFSKNGGKPEKKLYFFSEIFRAPFNGQFLKAISADIFRNLQTLRGSQKKKVLKMGKSAEACNFTKSNTPPWVFCIFLKLYKWYQIV